MTTAEFDSAPVVPQDAIPERLAKEHDNYLVMYGIRTDDAAFVFHFFPPLDRKEFEPRYGMAARLERAIPKCFDVRRIQANEVLETMRADKDDITPSYCIIVHGLGASPDPWPLVNRFFEELEPPL
jgi:hypothetical protein